MVPLIRSEALPLSAADLFVANAGGTARDYRSLTVVDASTGALVATDSGPQYRFNEPGALAIVGPDLVVGNSLGGSVTELPAP
jgi:hypothetical protein